MRNMVTLFTLLALAQMWNLLGGYAGLISVGQQAYIGLGAYGLWLLGDVIGLHPFIAVFASGPARGGRRPAGGAADLPPPRRLLRHRHVGGGRGRAAHRLQHPGDGRRLRQDRPLRRPAPDRHAHPGTYLLALFVAVGSILLVYFLLRSRLGLALTAIRDNDLAAQSSGVNVFRSKLFVYVIAAFGCGVVGAVVAMNLLRIQPTAAFTVNWTAYMMFIVVIGGFGTIEGPIIGAVIYFALLQSLSQYGTLYMLLLGVVAVVMVTLAPKGIWGYVAKRWNLHLFPVRRRLVMEALPPEEDLKPAEKPDAAVAESV